MGCSTKLVRTGVNYLLISDKVLLKMAFGVLIGEDVEAVD